MKNKFVKIYLPLLIVGGTASFIISQRLRRKVLMDKLQEKLATEGAIETGVFGQGSAFDTEMYKTDSKLMAILPKEIVDAQARSSALTTAIKNQDVSKIKSLLANFKSQSEVSLMAYYYNRHNR